MYSFSSILQRNWRKGMIDYDQKNTEEQMEPGDYTGYMAGTDLEPYIYWNGERMRNNGIRNPGEMCADSVPNLCVGMWSVCLG